MPGTAKLQKGWGLRASLALFCLSFATAASAATTLNPVSATVPATAGTGVVSMIVTPAAAWTATSSAAWLTVAPVSGAASSSLSYSWTANTSTNARQATITVAGKAFPVLQLGSDGNYAPWGNSFRGQIRTLAGNGNSGFSGDGGPASAATIRDAFAIAVDRNGLVYLADTINYRIRRIDPSTGIITTFAGTGPSVVLGDGGPASAASINPYGLAFDLHGNLYISDSGRIRRVDAATGIISTVAGDGTSTSAGDGGLATLAKVQNPTGIALDASGNLFFSETNAHRIRRIDGNTGIITTVAGTGIAGTTGDGGAATAARLIFPQGVAVDAAGNLYFCEADLSSWRVRRVDAVTGIITTFAGGGSTVGDGGPATGAVLEGLKGIAFDSAGNLIIATGPAISPG